MHTTINHYIIHTQQSTIILVFPWWTVQFQFRFFFFKSPSPQAFLSNRSSSSRQGQKFAVFFFLSSPRVLEPSPLELTTGAKMSKVCGTLLFSLSESILPPGLSPIGFFHLIFSILPITFRLDWHLSLYCIYWFQVGPTFTFFAVLWNMDCFFSSQIPSLVIDPPVVSKVQRSRGVLYCIVLYCIVFQE